MTYTATVTRKLVCYMTHNLSEAVEFGDLASYTAKARHITHNVSVEIDKLYSSVHEPIALHFLRVETVPHSGERGGARGTKMVPIKYVLLASH